jgi:hypothetical protein
MMTTLLADLAMNPFDDDIIREPRDVTFSVHGLNDNQMNRLVAVFAALETGVLPRRPVRPSKAQLVISPDQGYGKSHLLGRLLRTLGARATQVYLRPFQDPHKPWHSILLLTVQELERPPEMGGSPVSSLRPQLETLARSVLFHLGARLLASGRFPDYRDAAGASSYLTSLASDLSSWSESDAQWTDWARSLAAHPNWAGELVLVLNEQGVRLDGKERAWLKVLRACVPSAAFPSAPEAALARESQEAALKWIRAEPLEPDEVTSLGLANADNEGRGDSEAREINDLSFRRLRQLCLLASCYRPFLFCFDQTEFFASDPSLINAFGNCIDKLFSEVQNQMTIITANDGNWRNEIIPLIDQPQRARISPEIRLEGIKAEGATELIESRLREYDVGDADFSRFFAGGWLDSVFGPLPELGVRAVLQRAAARFQQLAGVQAPPSTQTLADLFQLQVNDVRSKRALLEYSQDALMWFTKDIGQHQTNVSISRPANRRYFSIAWEWPDRSVYFAFEGGDNSQRWRGIANEAIRIANDCGGRSVRCYVFRTPDLARIPRPAWKAIGPIITEAEQIGLFIYTLTLDQVCELHAARELYSNALQGNIAYSGPDTLAWLRGHFEALLSDLANRQFPPGAQNKEETKVETAPENVSHVDHDKQDSTPKELDRTHLQILVDAVKEKRLIDIRAVLSRLGGEVFRDPLLRSVETHPNLKAHPGPQTTFLQWRIAH